MRVLYTSRIFRLTVLLALGMAVISPSILSGQSEKATKRLAGQETRTFRPRVSPMDVAAEPAMANGQIGSTAMAQIAALSRSKDERTPAQQKISSRLLYTARMLQGLPAAEGVPYLETWVELDGNDNMIVDMKADVTDELLERLKGAGVHVISALPRYRSIRATIPAAQLEQVAGWSEIQFIGPAQPATTNAGSRFGRRFERPGTDVRARLSDLLSGQQTSAVGSELGEGDVTHKAALARSTFGISGAGLKIGVLSDGVSTLWQAQALGDLPDVTVIPNQEGDGDEGTAMLEIVHDLAPGARLYFATAFGGIDRFADNIRALREAGCDIIVDDVSYYLETRFQNGQEGAANNSTTDGGVVVQAVKDVVADGAIYFSSAANSGNKDADYSGTWEGNFVDGGATASPFPAGTVHRFSTGYNYNLIAYAGMTIFTWSDPLGASTNDYDLYVLNVDGTAVIALSNDTQSSANPADPIEGLYPTSTAPIPDNSRIVIVRKSGAQSRFLHLATNGGALMFNTEGATYGHNAAADAFGVAAAPAHEAFCPYVICPIGPFPDPFSASDLLEPFTSDGPRRIFYEGDGTPITPGNFSATGGTALQKPDITAADGVAVTGVGLYPDRFPNPFYGTSAAAPHAAAIAGLIWSSNPSLTPTQVGDALRNTAIDILTSGWDRNSGDGIVMAYEAVDSVATTGGANPNIEQATAVENPGNGDGQVTVGEGARLIIELNNAGTAAATGITGLVNAVTPGVSIANPNTVTFNNMPANGSATSDPIVFTLTSEFDPCATTAEFSLILAYTGGPSPRVLTFRVPVGQAPVSITATLGTKPPTAPGVTTATGMENGLVAFGNPDTSRCGSQKAYYGTWDSTVTYNYDSYTFTACRNACATIDVQPTSPNAAMNMFAVTYSPTFVPSNVRTNYVGDGGASYDRESYGISVTSGQSYTTVVEDSPYIASAVGQQYNIKIAGCAVNCLTPNRVPTALAHNVTVLVGPGGTAPASVNAGSSDPDGDELTITQTPPSPYPLGTTSVLLTVSDPMGATAQAVASVTVVPPSPDLAIVKSHTGNFTAGQTDATYTLAVSNVGQLPTTGVTTVVDTLPASLTASAISGTGWTCELATLTCTRSDVLAINTAYDPITVTVSVADSAPTSVTNTATVTGTGDLNATNNTASDATTVTGSIVVGSTAASATVRAGVAATYPLQIAVHGAMGNVTLACGTGMPRGTACSFNPATVTATGEVTLTITTTARNTASAVQPAQFGSNAPYYALLLIPFAGLLGLSKRNRRKLFLQIGAFTIILVMVMSWAACGGGDSNPPTPPPSTGTPAGTYTVHVNATAGTNTAATDVTLIVQ